MSVNGTSKSGGSSGTRTNYNSGGNTRSTNGTSKSPSGTKKSSSIGGFFSKMFGSSFDSKKAGATSKGTKTTKSTKTGTTTAKKGKNGVAHISSYVNAGKRGQMAKGTITVNGHTYHFNSGGAGKGNLPKGNYSVSKHMNVRTDKKSMMVGGVGYSFALSNKYDPRVKATRTDLRIHPDGLRPGTIGCIGIVGDAATQRQFRNDMNAELSRNGGHYSLNVN